MQDKTEKPTSRKLKRAKERGEVAKSSELVAALISLGGVLLLWTLSAQFLEGFKMTFTSTYSSLKNPELAGSLNRAFFPLLFPTLLIFLVLFLVAFLAHFFQTGWIWSWQRGKKNEKPRLFFTLIKIMVIGAIGFLALKEEISSFSFSFVSSSVKVSLIFKKIFFLLLELTLALLALGVCDLLYQKWRYFKQMQMTVQELKDEKRETEGDLETKSKMRHR